MLQRGNDVNEETRQAIIDQLNQHENLKRKIQDVGDDSDEYESNDEAYDDDVDAIKAKAMSQLDKMEDNIDNEEKPQKGIFAMKFMQKAFEKQRNLAKQSIIDMKKEMEEDEKLLNDDSDNENKEDNKKEKTVNVINTGRMQFSKTNKNDDNETDDDNDDKPINITTSSSLRVSGPINVNVKSNELKPVFDVEEFKVEDDSENPWLGDNDNLVQGSKKHINLNSKSNKEQKALEKLSQEKKKINKTSILNNEINFEEMKKLEQSEEITAKLSIAQNNDSKEIQKSNESIKSALEEEKSEEIKSKKIDDIIEGIAVENGNDIDEDNFQSITRGDLLQMAFSENDVFENEFNEEKQQLIDEENASEKEEALPGWGSWAGKGVKKRKKKTQKVEKKPKVNNRKDAKLKNVIINERRIKKSVKYMVSDIPHPFESREQYEKSLRAPVGKEWTTVNTHKEAIRPRVLTMPGKIIHPLKFTKQFSDKKEKKRPTKSRL